MKPHALKKAEQIDWDPADVICALRKKGITLTALAKAHGLAESSSLSATLVRSLPKNEKRIADALGLHPMDIWPSRYNADGTRKPQGFRAMQFNPNVIIGKGKHTASGGKSGKTS
ncbi:MAG: helix-turn-helix transcriptional regulator [Gallionellaceae bacterium]